MAKTIFLIDDSGVTLMSLRDNLNRSGFKVEMADSGASAIQKLTAGLKPDLIITDINMPNMNGIEVIRKVRALPNFRFVPILTLTTETSQDKREEGRQAGATGWLVKPIKIVDLVKVIKQILPGT
jgi:two-component system chemotaxis response regulator CheY